MTQTNDGTADQPNVVLILADDMGFSDLGVTEGKFPRRCWRAWAATACGFPVSTIPPVAALHAPRC